MPRKQPGEPVLVWGCSRGLTPTTKVASLGQTL